MIKRKPFYFAAIVLFFSLNACNIVSEEADKTIKELKSKSVALDSLINDKVEKVKTIDSLLNTDSEKLKKLDTLITNSSSKIDSISAKGIELLEKLNE